ncbi:MAG: Hsp20/alpha crystallin family protein [Halobacteriales archaeon]
MALPTSPTSDFTRSLDLPTRLFGSGSTDIELYEQEGEFLLSIELPGFDLDDIEVNWYEGWLTISAEHADEACGRQRTYHRSFRLPKAIEPEEIEASYQNGVLEVALPILEGATMRGQKIEVTG